MFKIFIDFSVGFLFVILWWVRVVEVDMSGVVIVLKYFLMFVFFINYKV